MRCGSWNIRKKGAWKQDIEVKTMLKEEKLNLVFIVETDTKSVKMPRGVLSGRIHDSATEKREEPRLSQNDSTDG